ncbi:hypothetical protein [Cellulomonas sp. Marseille-Q8402]
MDLVVEPAALAEAGTGLRSLVHQVPGTPRSSAGSSGSHSVDDALADFLASADASLTDAADALHHLGEAAGDAADAWVAVDHGLRVDG